MNNRIIKLFGDVTDETFDAFFDRYVELRAESKQPITLLINSDGGDVDSAIALFDLIQGSDVPIDGCVIGLAHSSACIILQACRNRTALPHASLMIHEGTIGGEKEPISPSEEMKNVHWNLERMRLSSMLCGSHTHLKLKRVLDLEKAVTYMTPTQAKKYGFLDDVVASVCPKLGKIKGRK